MRLIELEMTKEEYAALPHISTMTERDLKEIVPLGFRCKDSQGVVRELVKGMDMFDCQAGGCAMSLPERGWRYYTPKWSNTKVSDGH